MLESQSQSFAVRLIHGSQRQADRATIDPLETEFEEGAVVDIEQALGDVNSEIRVYADQVGVKRRMMTFGERQPVGHDRLSQLLVRVHDDMRGIKQP